MAYTATQSVKKETVPPLISNMAIVRLCLKVQNYSESNLVLGNLSGAGYNAATFSRHREGHRATSSAKARSPPSSGSPQVDGPQAAAVITRARAIRKARGLLTGYAVDDDLQAEDTQTPPLQHIADVWPAGESRMSFAAIASHASRSGTLRCTRTGASTRSPPRSPRRTSRSVQVNRGGRNLRGITHAALLAAIEPPELESGDE